MNTTHGRSSAELQALIDAVGVELRTLNLNEPDATLRKEKIEALEWRKIEALENERAERAEPRGAQDKPKPKQRVPRAEFYEAAAGAFERDYYDRLKAAAAQSDQKEWKQAVENERGQGRRRAAYIQYPLAIVHLFDIENREEQMDAALHYGVMNRTLHLHKSAGLNKQEAIAQAQADVWITGSKTDHVNVWKGTRAKLRNAGVDPDHTCLIRLPTRRAFAMRNLNGTCATLNNTDVRVLQAITSKVSDAQFAPMSRVEIQRAAAGAMSAAQWESLGLPFVLTESQVTHSIAKLSDDPQNRLVSRVIGKGRKGCQRPPPAVP